MLLKDLAHSRLLPGTLEALDHVQLVQGPLEGVVLEQTGVPHALLDAGEVDESDELDEQLPLKTPLGGDEDAPHVKTLLEVAEGLLHKILVAVQVERRGGVHGLVGEKDEEAEVLLLQGDSVLFDHHLHSPFRSRGDLEVPAVPCLVLGDSSVRLKFALELREAAVKGLLLLGGPVYVVVVVKVDAPGLDKDIFLVRAMLPVLPFGPDGAAVETSGLVVALEGAEPVVDRLKVAPDEGASTNFPAPFQVYWQVVNTGKEAEHARQLRGEIVLSKTAGVGGLTQKEFTSYTGIHWVECFIVKNSVCVARSGEFVVRIV